VEVKEDLNGMLAEDFIKNLNVSVVEDEETQSQQLIDEERAKNKTLSRELEAVKATAENLKKKFVSFFNNPLKK
jgi:hypothetical protein